MTCAGLRYKCQRFGRTGTDAPIPLPASAQDIHRSPRAHLGRDVHPSGKSFAAIQLLLEGNRSGAPSGITNLDRNTIMKLSSCWREVRETMGR